MSRVSFARTFRTKVKLGMKSFPSGFNSMILEGIPYMTPPRYRHLETIDSPVLKYAQQFANEHQEIGYLSDSRLSQDAYNFAYTKVAYMKKGLNEGQATLQAKRDLVKNIEIRSMELDMIQNQALKLGIPSFQPKKHLDHINTLLEKVVQRKEEYNEISKREALEETLKIKTFYGDTTPLSFSQVSSFTPIEYFQFIKEHPEYKVILRQDIVKDSGSGVGQQQQQQQDSSSNDIDSINQSEEKHAKVLSGKGNNNENNTPAVEGEQQQQDNIQLDDLAATDIPKPIIISDKNFLGYSHVDYLLSDLNNPHLKIFNATLTGVSLSAAQAASAELASGTVSAFEKELKDFENRLSSGIPINRGKLIEESLRKNFTNHLQDLDITVQDGKFINQSLYFPSAARNNKQKQNNRLPIISSLKSIHHLISQGKCSQELIDFIKKERESSVNNNEGDENNNNNNNSNNNSIKNNYVLSDLSNLDSLQHLTRYNEISSNASIKPTLMDSEQEKLRVAFIDTVTDVVNDIYTDVNPDFTYIKNRFKNDFNFEDYEEGQELQQQQQEHQQVDIDEISTIKIKMAKERMELDEKDSTQDNNTTSTIPSGKYNKDYSIAYQTDKNVTVDQDGYIDLSKTNIYSNQEISDSIIRDNHFDKESQLFANQFKTEIYGLTNIDIEANKKTPFIQDIVNNETVSIVQGTSTFDPEVLLSLNENRSFLAGNKANETSHRLRAIYEDSEQAIAQQSSIEAGFISETIALAESYPEYLLPGSSAAIKEKQDSESLLAMIAAERDLKATLHLNNTRDQEEKVDFRSLDIDQETQNRFAKQINQFREKESKGLLSDEDYFEFTNYLNFLKAQSEEPEIVSHIRDVVGLPTSSNNIIDQYNNELMKQLQGEIDASHITLNPSQLALQKIKDMFPDEKDRDEIVSLLLNPSFNADIIKEFEQQDDSDVAPLGEQIAKINLNFKSDKQDIDATATTNTNENEALVVKTFLSKDDIEFGDVEITQNMIQEIVTSQNDNKKL